MHGIKNQLNHGGMENKRYKDLETFRKNLSIS